LCLGKDYAGNKKARDYQPYIPLKSYIQYIAHNLCHPIP
jgi:hypothetical protein